MVKNPYTSATCRNILLFSICIENPRLGVLRVRPKQPPVKKEYITTPWLKSKTYVASQLFSRGPPKYATCVKEPQDFNILRLLYLTRDCQLFFFFCGPITA